MTEETIELKVRARIIYDESKYGSRDAAIYRAIVLLPDPENVYFGTQYESCGEWSVTYSPGVVLPSQDQSKE